MEFRETLLAAQKNQQQKSADRLFYKARFDPPKKQEKPKDKLSANIQKFLAKKEAEEQQKKLEAQRKRDELLALRDPKALRKIQKTLKVIKSANKSVIEDAVDRNNTAVTREGPDQPDQDDYGYESQAAAAIYEKMMQKYSQIPDEPKFSSKINTVKKDLNGTRERVKHALQHENDPVPRQRKRKCDNADKEPSPPPKNENDKKKEEKPKIRRPMPPPMDFNQLLKLAEQKKSEPIDIIAKKVATEPEPERLMTKKQKKEYEEEMARRQRRQERSEFSKDNVKNNPKVLNDNKPTESNQKEVIKPMNRIPKLNNKAANSTDISKDKNDVRDSVEKQRREKDRAKIDKINSEREKERLELERLKRLKAERERIDKDIERLSKNRENQDKAKIKPDNKVREHPANKLNPKDLASNSGDSFNSQYANPYRSQKQLGTSNSYSSSKNINERKLTSKSNDKIDIKNKTNEHGRQPNTENNKSTKTATINSFDFDKYMSSLKKNPAKKLPPDAARKQKNPDNSRKKRVVDSDSEHDSEMDDFIDDGEEDMDYSSHIKEIFGYDKNKYRNIDDDDDPSMESSFVRQQREEFISKKIGIMEDLEDMRKEAMEKKNKRKRLISD